MLEIMVTLALIAILAGLAAPSMIDFVRNNKMSTTARQLDADIVLARREAIKRNTRVLVCPQGGTAGKCGTVTTTAWTQGWLVCYDADFDNDCDDTAATNPNPIRQHAALESMLTITGPAAIARFNANGTQGGAGRGEPHVHDQGHVDGLEILRRNRHGNRQRFHRSGELRMTRHNKIARMRARRERGFLDARDPDDALPAHDVAACVGRRANVVIAIHEGGIVSVRRPFTSPPSSVSGCKRTRRPRSREATFIPIRAARRARERTARRRCARRRSSRRSTLPNGAGA
jgi:Tfp pilus assembly protein FimT